MSWKTEHRKFYEAGVVADALARLAKRVELSMLPLSERELQTLATRARQWFLAHGSQAKQQRLAKYKAHLASIHDAASVDALWTAFVEINNAIGYEEK